ncbi:MAG TPA: TIR domain-containing protein [Mycobacterium sp.]|jgi:hypothetical protein
MSVFICYSSTDGAAVRSLVADLEIARQTVWLDQDLTGGDAWWARILEQIRAADVFILALSDNSLQSKPCQSEIGYAKALGLPILPIQIADVESYRVDPIFSMQMVDYRNPTVRTGIGLVLALQDLAGQRQPLPDPLPDPPRIPYEYLQKLGQTIEGPDPIPHAEQAGILIQLRQGLRDEDDESVRNDIRKLLRDLRRRPEVTYATVTEIDSLLHDGKPAATGEQRSGQPPAQQNAAAAKAAGWFPDPSGNPQLLRYWDGKAWTNHVTDRHQAAP